jgi:transposase
LQKKILQPIAPNIIETTNLDSFKESVLSLLEKVELLSSENAALKRDNAELKARLNQNSQNSSRPPSGDGYRKAAKITKTKSSKPHGGQRGHKGNTLRQVDNPDQTVSCCPSQCVCGHTFIGTEDMLLRSKRQVFDVPQPQLIVTEYQIFECKCPGCGKISQGASPNHINSPVQYGNTVKALAVLMNNEYKMPIRKIRQIFKILFGYEISESTTVTMPGACYDRLSVTESLIKELISCSQVGHVDETGIRTDKKLNWLHVFSTESHTRLFAHPKRGKEAAESARSIIPDFTNWLVHDCWPTYFSFNRVKHALCNAHIIRELQGVIDNDKNGADCRAKKTQDFLISLLHTDYRKRIENQITVNSAYAKLCRQGLAAEPPPVKQSTKKGRVKKSKAGNLLRRLIIHKNSILAFAFNEHVPFTNNLAERDLRPAKIKLKISNVFRSKNGADHYAGIQGFISTARKNSKNILEELYNTFNGYNFITKPA